MVHRRRCRRPFLVRIEAATHSAPAVPNSHLDRWRAHCCRRDCDTRTVKPMVSAWCFGSRGVRGHPREDTCMCRSLRIAAARGKSRGSRTGWRGVAGCAGGRSARRGAVRRLDGRRTWRGAARFDVWLRAVPGFAKDPEWSTKRFQGSRHHGSGVTVTWHRKNVVDGCSQRSS